MQEIQKEIARCINQLLLKEPFFAHLLAGVNREYSEQVETAAVGIRSGSIVLFINEHFFLKDLKSSSERIAVIKHETLHLVFKHLFRNWKDKNSDLMNIAADLVVNQYIGNWKLPDTAITLKLFRNLPLKEKETLEYYYSHLENLNNKTHSELEEGGLSEDKAMLNKLISEGSHSDHSEWVEADSEVGHQVILLEKKLAEALKRTPTRHHGSIPSDLLEYLQSIENRKQMVDWKRVLRLFSHSNGRSYVSHSMKRISKRYGTRPGVKIKRLWNLCVVIDTSGSINREALELFFSEINHIHRCGAQIIIIQSDAKVSSVKAYRPKMEILIKGGGGTNFDPAFEYINTSNIRVGGVIYFTDGFAPSPQIKVKVPLLWLIHSSENNTFSPPWGKVIQMGNLHGG